MDDRFSQLTDDLLIKILSFVPTKDAVAMTILSKRWMFLWTLVPRLKFDDWVVDHELHCLPSHFVYGTLLLNKSPVLESFRLSSCFEYNASEIYLWVRIAVDRFVRELSICFKEEHCPTRLPSSLFRCETLETLELRKVIFKKVPSRFSFPTLRKLSLVNVKYADEEYRLISSSPVLQKLVVMSCSDDNVVTFTINVPSLRSLAIENRLSDSGTNDHRFVIHSHSLNQLKIIDEFGEIES